MPTPAVFSIGIDDAGEVPLVDLRAGFRSGFVFELIDVRQDAPIQVYSLPINPTTYHLSEPFAVTLTPTEDNTVKSEANGIIIREITLDGTFGVSEKKAGGVLGAQGNGAALSGDMHFLILRAMFRKYGEMRKDPALGAFVRLVFHCIRDDDHFIVEPRVFDTPRDSKSARMHYVYHMTLAAIAVVDGSSLRLAPPEGEDLFTSALRTINEAFNDARAEFAEATADIAMLKRKLQNVETVLINAGQMVNAVGNFLKGATEFIDYPISLAVSTIEQVEQMADDLTANAPLLVDAVGRAHHNLKRLQSALERMACFRSKFSKPSSAPEVRAYAGERTTTRADLATVAPVGAHLRATRGSERRAGLDLGGFDGFSEVEVTAGTSLDSLASRYRVPRELLILINDLSFPYFAPGGGPGMLGPGDIILVPVRTGAARDPDSGGGDYLTTDELLYGVDIALDRTLFDTEQAFDLQIDEVHGSDDVELVRGIENVVQGTIITVETPLGATTFLPDVGIRRNVGVKGTVTRLLLASLNLREAILADDRIESIQALSVVLNGDVLSQEITPRIRGAASAPRLVRPIGRASGG